MKRPRRIKTPSSGSTSTTRKTTAKRPISRKRTVKTGEKEAPKRSAFKRGMEGFDNAEKKRARQEEEYQRNRETPYDFRLAPGDEAEIILLDDEPPFFVNLHKVKINGRWQDEVCIADTGDRCPLCESEGKEGSTTLVLTALDRRPYKIKNGPNAGKTIKASKKLVKVKGRNLAKFKRAYQRAKESFRGLKVLCRRDGDKEAAIGEDIEFLGKIKNYEAFLAKFGDNSKAADYEKIFAIPTAKELRQRHHLGASKAAGSEEFDENADEADGDMEGVGWE